MLRGTRELVDRRREGHRQTAGRVDPAEQHTGNRLSTAAAGVEGGHHGRYPRRPGNADRTAGLDTTTVRAFAKATCSISSS
jgi:hypothetical protein